MNIMDVELIQVERAIVKFFEHAKNKNKFESLKSSSLRPKYPQSTLEPMLIVRI